MRQLRQSNNVPQGQSQQEVKLGLKPEHTCSSFLYCVDFWYLKMDLKVKEVQRKAEETGTELGKGTRKVGIHNEVGCCLDCGSCAL